MTAEQAVEMAKSQWWEGMAAADVVSVQLYEEKLCMDFSAFHAAVEEVLGRPVWTHEFAWPAKLRAEFEGRVPRASFADVMAKLPPGVPVVVVVAEEAPDAE